MFYYETDKGRVELSEPNAPMFTPSARLWLTLDDCLVEDGQAPSGSRLFCVPGRPIPMSEAKKYGLVKESVPTETKEIRPKRKKNGDRISNG